MREKYPENTALTSGQQPLQTSRSAAADSTITTENIVPHLIQKVTPTYPPIAKAAHVQGNVILHAIIGSDGSVQNLSVISGPENSNNQWRIGLNAIGRRISFVVIEESACAMPRN